MFSNAPKLLLCWAQIEAELQAAVSEAQQARAGLAAGVSAAPQDASLPEHAAEADAGEAQPDEQASGTPLSFDTLGARIRAAPAGEPDFAALAQKYPSLRKHVRLGAAGRGSIDFTDFEAARYAPEPQPCTGLKKQHCARMHMKCHWRCACACQDAVCWSSNGNRLPYLILRQLTRALLEEQYGIRDWWVPDGHLIPPVTNRANYIHWLAELLRISPGRPTAPMHPPAHLTPCCFHSCPQQAAHAHLWQARPDLSRALSDSRQSGARRKHAGWEAASIREGCQGMQPGAGSASGAGVSVLDIGCGANLIYPLLGAAMHGWAFVGADITDAALAWSEKNKNANPHLAPLLEVRRSSSCGDSGSESGLGACSRDPPAISSLPRLHASPAQASPAAEDPTHDHAQLALQSFRACPPWQQPGDSHSARLPGFS